MIRNAILLSITLAAGAALADEPAWRITKIEPGTTALQPLPAFPGVSNGFLIGAFDRAGLYAAEGEMAAGSTFPPHTHPDTRLTIVISGTMYLGEGTTADPARLIAYPAGTAAITPGGTPHYMAAQDGDVRVLEIGAGPSGFAFAEGDAQ
ncbi:MAG: cupin domain-containing protein [Pseudomonadota bacterium]